MAFLYAKTPEGNTKSINLDTMNIETGYNSDQTSKADWWQLPTGLIIQRGVTSSNQKIADGVYRVVLGIQYTGLNWYSISGFARPASRLSTRFATISCATNDETGSYFTISVMSASGSAVTTEVSWMTIGH